MDNEFVVSLDYNLINDNWVIGSPPQFDTLLAVLHLTYSTVLVKVS